MKTILNPFLLRFCLVAVLTLSFSGLYAQEQISWGDEEEEEFVLEKRDAAVITVNGVELDPSSGLIEFPREQTLSIEVRFLQPGSFLSYQVEKTGLKLKSQRFKANGRGELDLEVGTGKKKGGAQGTIHYFSSSGNKVTIQAKIKII